MTKYHTIIEKTVTAIAIIEADTLDEATTKAAEFGYTTDFDKTPGEVNCKIIDVTEAP